MLFDLVNDPGENNKMICEDRCQEIIQRLHKDLIAMIGDDRQHEITGKVVDSEVEEKLKALGYL